MRPSYPFAFLLCAATLWLAAPRATLAAPPTRQLAYPEKVNGPLGKEVEALLNAAEPPVPDGDLAPGAYFLRVVAAEHVLDRGMLKKGAVLGPRPFTFLTCPAAARGKDLLTVFSDIGYSADQVLESHLGRPMAAVVFRYPEVVRFHDAGVPVPPDGWRQRVYPATWSNAAALLERLAAEADLDAAADQKRFTPDKLVLAGERERSFLHGFPASGLKRVAACPYAVLRETGGADWEFRSLLERRLGLGEHFAGTGRTKPAIGRQDGRRGLPEWLGPNARLEDLPEVAVIRIGALEVAR